jgi:DNA-binding transcriptional MerR regulator
MQHEDTIPYLHIGALASELGINTKTIRYYEELGLLPAPARTASGYRLYTPGDREQLEFIIKAKTTGLTLEEIGEILALWRQGREPCEHVAAMLDRKLDAIDRQLQALTDLRHELASLRDEARAKPAAGCVCGIIEQHASQLPLAPAPLTFQLTGSSKVHPARRPAEGPPDREASNRGR